MSGTTFLRSIRLRDDLAEPRRFAHYRPTRKSTAVIDAVIRPNAASMVVAAYGSGKSMAAGIGALLVRNDTAARAVATPILDRMSRVDRTLADAARRRQASRGRGIVVTLSGFVDRLAAEIAEQAGLAEAGNLDKVLKAVGRLPGHDHIAIVWDEFGRHLEGIVDHGRSAELDQVQTLAEWTVRAAKPTASLTLLMHQNLLAYAGRLNQATRSEWRKVEGRFTPIRFLEDSFELYELLADVISEGRGANPSSPPDLAAAAIEAGWFGGETDVERVERVIRDAWPISAGALHALPALVARVGQNERSLFSFLASERGTGSVGFEEVYTAFSDAMRSDVGIGGTHRRWVEAEGARSRATDAVENEILAAACILQLGRDGERRRLPRAMLELAVVSRGYAPAAVRKAVDALIDRSLLLWRTRNDDVSVWHGADIDVASRVREERDRRSETFDLASFLLSRLAAPFVRPVAHNVRLGVTRHLKGNYLTARELGACKDGLPPTIIPVEDEDGRVVYVLAESHEDLKAARKVVLGPMATGRRIVFAVPDEPCELREAALEVVALEALRSDKDFLSADPLVGSEIDELLSVARGHLDGLLRRLTDPRPSGTTWYHDGQALDVTPDRPASVVASRLMDRWFPQTPHVANDGIMRDRISRQMRTARVRVMRSSLERCGRPHLGYDPEDRSAEASIYRTVLAKTGLYLTEDGSGRFADPGEMPDAALGQAWARIGEFFGTPSSDAKPMSDLVGQLAGEPFGLPRGLIPILATAGYVRFARAVALTCDGLYLPDILGYDVERIFQDPKTYAVKVLDPSSDLTEYLGEVAYVFAHERPGPGTELVRFAYDAVSRWRASIPDAARRTNRLSVGARDLVRLTSVLTDPVDLLLHAMPGLPGIAATADEDKLRRAVVALERFRNEVDGLVDGYAREAVQAIAEALTLNDRRPDPVAGVQDWVGCLDVDALIARSDLRATDKAILRTTRETANGRFNPKSLARALSSVLLQKGLEQWGDATVDQFRTTLREARSRIEDAALDAPELPATLRPVVEAKIGRLEEILRRLPASSENVVSIRKAQVP